jgi:hypothetical protein
MNDHAEVGPLSRPAMFQPVSFPLQKGVRFLRTPLPAASTAFLAVRLPLPATLRAYPVPHEFLSGADPSFSPAAYLSTMAHGVRAIPCRLPFWFKPVSTFGLSNLTTFTRGSHMLVVSARP